MIKQTINFARAKISEALFMFTKSLTNSSLITKAHTLKYPTLTQDQLKK